jgi:hypothetical protein
MDNSSPSPNGRSANGRFGPGNRGGPGNPHGRRVAELRAILLEAVSDDDFRAIAAKLVERAKSGDLFSIRELLDRLMGKPVATVAVEQSDELEFRTREQMKTEIMERLKALREERGVSGR